MHKSLQEKKKSRHLSQTLVEIPIPAERAGEEECLKTNHLIKLGLRRPTLSANFVEEREKTESAGNFHQLPSAKS
jgi:hypothetical protein